MFNKKLYEKIDKLNKELIEMATISGKKFKKLEERVTRIEKDVCSHTKYVYEQYQSGFFNGYRKKCDKCKLTIALNAAEYYEGLENNKLNEAKEVMERNGYEVTE